MTTPTASSLVMNFIDSISGFLLETGNIAYNLKKYKEANTTEDKAKYLTETFFAGSLAIGHLGELVTGEFGNHAKHTNIGITAVRLAKHIADFKKDWNNNEIDVNLFQNILADGFSLLGMSVKNNGLGVLFSATADIISAKALETSFQDRPKIPFDDFNAENIEGFIIELLQPLSDAIYDLFDKIDSGISALLNNQDDSWVDLIIDKFDSNRLVELDDDRLAQNAVFEQLHNWYYYKVTNEQYNEERFFSDNKDALQYTTAQGEGFDVDENNQYVSNILLNLSREINNPYLAWTSFTKDLCQWNIITNEKSGNGMVTI